MINMETVWLSSSLKFLADLNQLIYCMVYILISGNIWYTDDVIAPV